MDFLREAEIAFQLRHENILTYYGVVIASSYSPYPALVSYSHLFYISVTWLVATKDVLRT